MSKEMLINSVQGEECRVAVVDNKKLDELYIERASLVSHVGNMYKGKIVNIEPSIQAAFIDFGLAKNGFLHISDVHPKYLSGKADKSEKIGRRQSLSKRPPIQRCLKKGQELIVQVTKEGIGTKGPTLTTYLSLPGKHIVMMPGMSKVGVSQKIEDEDERKRLKKIIDSLELPKDFGFIIRTAAIGATKRSLRNDVNYLTRLWKAIRKKMETSKAPAEIYKESDLVIRTIRDVFTSSISKIVCDSEIVSKKARDFLSIIQPRLKRRVIYYDGKTPLFHKYGIEQEITNIQSSRVELNCGGSLVIEQTEALVAIDVNSGRYRKHENAEATAHKTNMEAAKEIVRQLKLRDLGGLIVCDFIDMRDRKNKRQVEQIFRDELKSDRARSKALRMSAFGLIEVTRQRMRPSLQSTTYLKCPRCGGKGIIKNLESQSLELMRTLNLAVARGDIKRIEMLVEPDVASFMLNENRAAITQIETQSDKQILIKGDPNVLGDDFKIDCFNERGSKVQFMG
ncbi:Ribonuclease E [Anaerohalosphaera lusitana]|uniref:Ribonuclease G n=1 Tax=Anaerohalosphaera lusitana TaxID=1936003 RepID=A0A1U9NLR4_9BACT|nr:Rne/Rng family ribonuclease [Anaerohalosphaera lusitana]AQT68881.1 Ribonuclease E [Anaerohalosphaera lusitana]